MKKEEFLAFSLPYGLIVADKCTNENLLFAGLNLDSCELLLYSYIYGSVNENIGEYGINMFDPVLHPMPDLTKTIEHNGEKFVPLHRLLENSGFNLSKMTETEILNYKDVSINTDLLGFNDAMYLISIHFDLFDLISKNEAIDVNTLEINPYR